MGAVLLEHDGMKEANSSDETAPEEAVEAVESVPEVEPEATPEIEAAPVPEASAEAAEEAGEEAGEEATEEAAEAPADEAAEEPADADSLFFDQVMTFCIRPLWASMWFLMSSTSSSSSSLSSAS